MKELSDIAISIEIPVDYTVGVPRRLYQGKWIPLTAGEEIMRARESGKEWVEEHLPRPDARVAEVIVKPSFVCSHCKAEWTEDGPHYNGGCCDEDEKNNPENLAAEPSAKGAEDGR